MAHSLLERFHQPEPSPPTREPSSLRPHSPAGSPQPAGPRRRGREAWLRAHGPPAPPCSALLRPAGPASSAGPAPPPPYQGFGYVSPLGDVFAVLLVSHPDPLFGHHGLGAWGCSRLPPARMAGVSRSRKAPRLARALQVARRGRAPRTPLPEPQPAGSRERPARGRK